MSRKKINLNYKIKSLEERSEYLEKHLDIDSRSRKKWIIPSKAFKDTNGDMDYYLESAASYLLRSKDVGSPKDLEYSYFIDERDFKNEYRYKNPRLTSKERDLGDKDLYVTKSILTGFDDESMVVGKDFNGKPLTAIDYNIYEDSNDIFKIDEDTRLRDVVKYIPYIDVIEDLDRRVAIKDEMSKLVENIITCFENDFEEEVFNLLIQDYSIPEIAECLEKTTRQVRYAINKVENKYSSKYTE